MCGFYGGQRTNRLNRALFEGPMVGLRQAHCPCVPVCQSANWIFYMSLDLTLTDLILVCKDGFTAAPLSPPVLGGRGLDSRHLLAIFSGRSQLRRGFSQPASALFRHIGDTLYLLDIDHPCEPVVSTVSMRSKSKLLCLRKVTRRLWGQDFGGPLG